ncbi:MAG: multicopper oxidase family protein [Burkholderiaceae bacterium]|nr:multicopper oxidase family protein [Burkholderiaceae bacterium]
MDRRNFLANLIGLTGLAWSADPLWAQGTMGHSMGDMGGMGNMAGMSAMDGMAMPGQRLAPDDALSTGNPFRRPAALLNEATEAGQFRATLVAAPTRFSLLSGRPTEAWSYNGGVPGPLIELTAGDEVEITLHNRLTQPTTIHWHGLPVPADQDGNPSEAVPPGGSRVYRFTLPEDINGLYWYHPHPHRLSAEQVYRGLAGPILVRAKHDPLASLPERIMTITDLRLAADGTIPANDMMDWMNGREGQFVLVNGQRRPTLTFDTGGRERWRILNATNARYLRLQMPGQAFALVGTDGGLIERPQTGATEILMAPAQRVDLVVDATGQRTAQLIAAPYDRGKMGGAVEDVQVPLLDVVFGAARAVERPALPPTLRSWPQWAPATTKKRVVMSESMSMTQGGHAMRFLLNGKSFDMRRVDLVSRAGVMEEWEIVNDSDMDHPFHLHGTQFLVVERALGGKIRKASFRALYDTVNVQPHETVRLKVLQTLKGIRMFHCHLLEHEDLGMMGRLDVI